MENIGVARFKDGSVATGEELDAIAQCLFYASALAMERALQRAAAARRARECLLESDEAASLCPQSHVSVRLGNIRSMNYPTGPQVGQKASDLV
ncbi:hypothetical protein ACWCPQ_29505 [Nocardia sp. NPDC001965]